MNLRNPREKNLIVLLTAVLILLTLFTEYYGSTDLGDYSDTARFFAGHYSADIRSSHSYLYGFIHSPLIYLFDSYVVFKFTSLIFLLGIVYSIYLMSNKSRKAFLLMLLSPVVWYMAPWINPIQLASLFFLWAFYFMEKYERTNKALNLIYSGILIGLALAFWDTIVFFGFFLSLPYIWNKKSFNILLLGIAVLVGMLPRIILDSLVFGFPFFSLAKSFFGTLTNAFLLGRGTSYAQGLFTNLILFILIILTVPIYFWAMCKNKNFRQNNSKSLIFIFLSITLIIINPQIRYAMIIVPIITLVSLRYLSPKQLNVQIALSAIISILFILPYIVYIGASFNNSQYYDITEIVVNLPNIKITFGSESEVISKDLINIGLDYPGETFLVIGNQDYYQKFAHLYWGDDIKEFVSSQDYELWKKGDPTIFEKRIELIPKINGRRAIWIGGGIFKNPNEDTNYSGINYVISEDESENEECYVMDKEYNALKVLRKIC